LSYFLYVDIMIASSDDDDDDDHRGSVHHDDVGGTTSFPTKSGEDVRGGAGIGGSSSNNDGGGTGIRFLEVHVTVLEGRDLVAKDKNIWGKRISSDPYVKVYHGTSTRAIGRTNICKKTLHPQWTSSTMNEFQIRVLPQALDAYPTVECQIWDHDHLSSDDSMGVCVVPVPTVLNRKETKWIPVTHGGQPGDETYCHNATGELKVEIEVKSRLSRGFRTELCKTASQRGGFVLE
jgi:C2 domain